MPQFVFAIWRDDALNSDRVQFDRKGPLILDLALQSRQLVKLHGRDQALDRDDASPFGRGNRLRIPS